MGDICFDTEAIEKIKGLLGYKILVMGNHDCITLDTEVLTTTGWVLAEDINPKDKLAQYSLIDGEITYATPIGVSSIYKETAIIIEGHNTKQVVSTGHDVIHKGIKLKAKHLLKDSGSELDIPTYGFYNAPGLSISDLWLSYLTWVIMDGTIVHKSAYNKRIQFKLSKPKKIKLLQKLLEKAGIAYTIRKATMSGINKLQPFYICIYGDAARTTVELLSEGKQLQSSWLSMSKDQLRVVLDTLENTDGHRSHNVITWSTISKSDIDILQHLCVLHGYTFRYVEKLNVSGFSNGKLQYVATIFTNPKATPEPLTVATQPYNDLMVSIQMPETTIITRKDGKVAITGNCERGSCDTKMLWDAFDKVISLTSKKGCWLSHCPIHPEELRGKFNISGHIHNHVINDPRYANVCLENTNYQPVDMKEVIATMERGEIFGTLGPQPRPHFEGLKDDI